MKVIRRTRGVALITAILITALAGIVAANLAWDSTLDVRRTSVLLARDQAVQVALGAEDWLQSILRDDAADTDTDHLGEIWAGEFPILPIEGGQLDGEIYGQVEDLQGRFNINSLVDDEGEKNQDAVEQFQRLLLALGLNPRFAGIAADWIDTNQDAEYPDGAEDPIYSGFIPPYRAPNQSISTPSELAAIEGIDKATLDLLLPHVAALPRGQRAINVNTATAAVLQSLDEEITAADVESLLGERADAGFADIGATFQTLAKEAYKQGIIVENTEYFQLKLIVRIDTVRITYYSVIERRDDGAVAPILRSLGTT